VRLVWISPHLEREIVADQLREAAAEMRRMAAVAQAREAALAGQVEALALFSGAVLGLLADPSGDGNGYGNAVMRFACLFGLVEPGPHPHSVSLTALGTRAMSAAALFNEFGSH
jgi:hypothetical protein